MKAAAVYASGLVFGSLHVSGFAEPGAVSQAAPESLDAQVQYILDHPLTESEYSPSTRCMVSNSYESIEILDASHLLFVGRRGAIWLNQLRSDCVGLDKDSVLVFHSFGTRVCDMDSFLGAERYGLSTGFAAHCTLGHFEPITQAQADVLRDALARAARPTSKVADDDAQP
jgi:hypothetical protein